MIYRFRAILDTKEDVFRDIEIDSENTLEELHNGITQAFGFEGNEMASFYVSNENWEQGEEIALFDMSEGMESIRIMNETSIDDVTDRNQPRLLYVYDFLNMWTFYVELMEINEPKSGVPYPRCIYSEGLMPGEREDFQFESHENLSEGQGESGLFDNDILDEFNEYE